MSTKILDNLHADYPGVFQAPLKVISVSGADSSSFLQGQLSCDLEAVSDHKVVPGLYCNRQGRIICDFLIFHEGDAYFLIMHESVCDPFIQTIKHFAMFSKVEFVILANQVTFSFSNNANDNNRYYESDSHSIRTIYNNGFLLELHQNAADAQENQLLWTYLQIITLHPEISIDNSEKYLPHRLDYHLQNYINFKKGCYLGQEVIARMHYKSQHKHGLFHVVIDELKALAPDAVLKTQDQNIKLDLISSCFFGDKLHVLISCDKQARSDTHVIYQDDAYQLNWMPNE